ncbi:coiled-coil domain-containing protein 30 [Dickeya sp. NCPPB 3274]|uniref:coiled-coil domain-containing protein 30 n=1 Tax=Dickeya sp. NCPPB 3274 TaxID=568766 RepID=UPI0003A1F8F5|nr:coiled-coil domain-containing protein 30 [Dickeya sp. NCPPB 3274]
MEKEISQKKLIELLKYYHEKGVISDDYYHEAIELVVEECDDSINKEIVSYLFKKGKEKEIFIEKIHPSLEEENKKLKLKISDVENDLSIAKSERNVLFSKMRGHIDTISSQEERISTLERENKELIEKSQQNRIDDKIPEYVLSVKEKLNSDDRFFIDMSNNWAFYGALACIIAVIAAFCTFSTGIEKIIENKENSAIVIFYIFSRGLLAIGLLSWLSYICFSNARKYTHESIRRKDRQHALMFGQIFLQIFGGTATKDDAIKVFKDWNMSGDSAFSSKTESPPNALSIIESIKETFTSKNKKDSDNRKTDE